MGYKHWTGLTSNVCGIYKITNLVNGKFYIGQSNNIRTRWWQHRSELNNNKHDNIHLQNSWNKYGMDNFSFNILELCDEVDLDNREIFWISKLNSINPDIGYNILIGGNTGARGRKLTLEQKERMSKLRNPDKVVQIDFMGNVVNIWRSATHAQRTMGNVRARSILLCCKHKGYQACGYIWLYLDEFLKMDFDIEKYLFDHRRHFDIPIVQYDLYGNKLKEWNQSEIKNSNDFNFSVIKACCNHVKCTHNGYIWKYKYDNDFILTDEYLSHCRKTSGLYYIDQYDLNMNFIKTWFSQDLSKNTDFDIYSINGVCRNKYGSHKGYIWREHLV